MNHKRTARRATWAVVLGSALLGLPSGALASDASIKEAIKSYVPEILVSEGHVVSAIGEYKKTGNPSGVQAALTESISVLNALKSKIAAQAAVKPKVKAGKAKLVKGLRALVLAYQSLKKAIGEKAASPAAAKAEAQKAVKAVKKGAKELNEGIKLLR
jgi:hypothetical protein